MAVKRLSYGVILERELARGTSLKGAMKIARAKSEVIKTKKKVKAKKAISRKSVSRPIGYWGLRPLKRKKKVGK